MNKPKPDILKFILRFVAGALLIMVLASSFHFCWYWYHTLTNKVAISNNKTAISDIKLIREERTDDIDEIHYNKLIKEARAESFSLEPIEGIKDGAK